MGPGHEHCPDQLFDRTDRKYPTRLLRLPPYTKKRYSDSDEGEVRLIMTWDMPIEPLGTDGVEDDQMMRAPTGEYVTLSHCWGNVSVGRARQMKKLLTHSVTEFFRGVALKDLSPTFREAIGFARRLRPEIRFIWIDALCIIQDDDREWCEESVKMHDVYRNSILNISATAATDSYSGIYGATRNPQNLWLSEIDLNIRDIRNDTRAKHLQRVEPAIKRCKIRDLTMWDRLVDHAPVNERGWVLQERLLAPRILHFCDGQIAWECRHLEATESLPEGVPSVSMQADHIVQKESLKRCLPPMYGPKPIDDRPDEALECWVKIIQRYSKTQMSRWTDRLRALAGIAELVSTQTGKDVKYIAGLWSYKLASQMLWQVNVQSEQHAGANALASRPAGYAAPSFSFASVRAPHGIICGKLKPDNEMLFDVINLTRPQTIDGSEFGALEPGYGIRLSCYLHDVEILKVPDGEARTRRLRWRLKADSHDRDKEYPVIVLDNPEHDVLGRPEDIIVCCGIPAYRNEKQELVYLLVQQEGEDRYSRIGVARTSRNRGGSVMSWEDDSKVSRSPLAAKRAPTFPLDANSNKIALLEAKVAELQQEIEMSRQQYVTMQYPSSIRPVRRSSSGLFAIGERSSYPDLPSTSRTKRSIVLI